MSLGEESVALKISSTKHLAVVASMDIVTWFLLVMFLQLFFVGIRPLPCCQTTIIPTSPSGKESCNIFCATEPCNAKTA